MISRNISVLKPFHMIHQEKQSLHAPCWPFYCVFETGLMVASVDKDFFVLIWFMVILCIMYLFVLIYLVDIFNVVHDIECYYFRHFDKCYVFRNIILAIQLLKGKRQT